MLRRFWLLLTPALILLASCTPLTTSSRGGAGFVPPLATAPPTPGVEPPPVQLLVAGGPPVAPDARPQQQLATWAESMSDELNIPRAALQAYGYAQQSIATAMPRCGLTWSLLAAIGQVESSHGRHGGARLDETGRPTRPIIGLPLDGTGGVRRIPDTDGGDLDGDQVWDRAVGPLQFIPTTWHRWQVDADGDGVADPQDTDDAALTAGRYLCSAGGDLRDPDRFWSALLTYNQSRSYGQEVLDYADYYGRTSRELPAAG
ncbi:lytic transglycosylase domain-containing protein [Saccharopolyspora sp. K220]|uniref:lytic transglycosylase domain-containing protein n=1 Tax=Saccharopolyspora soli TaxID=2926618 RepID=UPI001F56A1E8|nr:lytic transglycosylase domain-containing protein [Saccharopolyspora soli]MCI2420692.1 lytic transglycosylase domain-containing protein [Saccharopolyspora soli]